MKRCLLLLVIFTLTFSSTALAARNYAGVKLGYSGIEANATLNVDNHGSYDFSDDYTTFGFGVFYGGVFAKREAVQFRFEVETFGRFGSVELINRQAGYDKVEINFSNSLLGGIYLDFPLGDRFTPYAGALLGLNLFSYKAKSSIKGGYISESSLGINFQYGLAAGMAYNVTDRWVVDLNARYLLSSKYTIDYESKNTSTDFDIKIDQPMYELGVGLRYRF